MKTTELQKLAKYLERGGTISNVDEDELLKELMQINELLKRQAYSLAPPTESLLCPQCGYKIY